MATRKNIIDLVTRHLALVKSPELLSRMSELLVAPYAVKRRYYYDTDKHLECWIVAESLSSNIGIAYSVDIPGNRHSWFLISVVSDNKSPDDIVGLDCEGFPRLEDAFNDLLS